MAPLHPDMRKQALHTQLERLLTPHKTEIQSWLFQSTLTAHSLVWTEWREAEAKSRRGGAGPRRGREGECQDQAVAP